MKKCKSHAVCLLVLLILPLRLPAPAAGDIPGPQEGFSLTVDDVLSRYAEACGGEALRLIQTETRYGTLLRYISGQVPLTVIAEAGGKWYYNQLFAWGDQISYGFNGRTAWVQTTESVGDMNSELLLDMRLLFDPQAPLKLKEFYPELTLKGTERVGEKDTVVLTAMSVNGSETELVFDKETGLLLRAGDMSFEDYREVGSVKKPFRILLGRDQGEEHRQMKMQFTEIKQNEPIDGSVFEIPECALPVADPPLYKARKQFEPNIDAMDECVGIYQYPERKEIKFRIFREDNHLFIEFVGRGFRIEIIPESELDYYTKFLGWEFHFIKDEQGDVKELIISANTTIKTVRIE
jgi:hypothetical protein